ncbi:MAG: hypothetical protein Q8L93_09610 [Rhodocyclaceae bacterium]|nr:hypothetical protein [Rhodocyclaceae bacterium]
MTAPESRRWRDGVAEPPPAWDGGYNAFAMTPESIDTFIARWQAAGGSERANYQLFITELCALLALPKPEPAQADARDNAYVFERRVIFRHGDGGSSSGFIDCYRRACFILEAKQTKLAEAVGKVFDDALLRARTAFASPTCATRPFARVFVLFGSTRRVSTPPRRPPKLRARLPTSLPLSPNLWKRSTRPRLSPVFSPVACSACSPRMSGCCQSVPSRNCSPPSPPSPPSAAPGSWKIGAG